MARKVLTLRIVASSLEGSGDAKLCRDNMDYLGLNDGDEIDVLHSKYSVLLDAYEDTIYNPDTIRLKSEDIFLLGAREGTEVDVSLPAKESPVKKSTAEDEPKKKKKAKKKRTKKRKTSKKKGKKKK